MRNGAKGILKERPCAACGQPTLAKRSDAKCRACHGASSAAYRAQPRVKSIRNERYHELRRTVVEGYGGACECCGEDHYEFLAIDHRYGGGAEERRRSTAYQMMTAIVVEGFPPTYRLLCHNCNQARGYYGECPHEREAL